ncbi:hypothetical protein IW261DRAFT_574581 [Armillaria novae-zelandiae]|uniref:Uncharacterized protein n=1 Tax=Armillaria novae-zelandiae TaxID=153914 RepID=A0AA39U9J0_9AGAR|nr:hypothetical protein IW261DRAFT_574581 [Armillaria novae-zelandiae]
MHSPEVTLQRKEVKRIRAFILSKYTRCVFLTWFYVLEQTASAPRTPCWLRHPYRCGREHQESGKTDLDCWTYSASTMPPQTFGRNIGSKGGVISYLHLEIIIPEAAASIPCSCGSTALYGCEPLHDVRVLPVTESCNDYRYSNRSTLNFESEDGPDISPRSSVRSFAGERSMLLRELRLTY